MEETLTNIFSSVEDFIIASVKMDVIQGLINAELAK